jgi:NodT family efflux transporter outer membrane factor (OMF) lipoprotein
MKFKSIIKYFLLSAVFAEILTSCFAQQKYQRPNDVVNENLFRTDFIPKDSLSTGNLSWKEIFTDTVLQNHISKALENNLDIRIALQNIAAADAYLKQAKTAYFPSISAGPDYSFSTPSLNSVSGQSLSSRTYYNQFDITANLDWEIDVWGKLTAQKKAQMANYLGSVAAHQAVKSDLVAAIASDYYQLLAYDEQKKIIDETVQVRQKNLEATQALKQAGTVTEVAVQQSEALVYNAQSLLITLDSQIQLLENTMSLLEGEPAQKIERSSLESQKLPENFDLGYPANLLENRPDVKEAEFNLINAFELTNAAKAQFFPSLRITGSGGVQSINIDQLFSANSLFANVLAGLTQPIFNKRQVRTNYDISLANREKAYLNFKKTVLTAGKEVSDAMNIYSVQDSFIDLKQKELATYQKSVSFSQELLNYGMANYLDVLNAEVNRLNAELNISNAKLTKLNAGVELYRALGGGWR